MTIIIIKPNAKGKFSICLKMTRDLGSLCWFVLGLITLFLGTFGFFLF